MAATIRGLLPPDWQAALDRLSTEELRQAAELRLRTGFPPTILLDGREHALPGAATVEASELEALLGRAAEHSLYAVREALSEGYLTLPGGHRIGICGTAVSNGDGVDNIKEISSLCIRIARSIPGIGTALAERVHSLEHSALIIGPPGSGKTTLLRDAARQLSDCFDRRVCIVDERGEIAAVHQGSPRLPVGRRTDVLTGFPKERGIELLLRAMDPEWIVLDEITRSADVEAMIRASYCGVWFLATAHAESVEDLQRRPVYRTLSESGLFQTIWGLDRARRGRLL